MKEQRTITPRLLTMDEAVVYLKIPLDTLYKMVSQGRIPVVKLNRHNRFDPVMLEEWIKKNTRMPIY
jgi:excisionase family DNA binding protein